MAGEILTPEQVREVFRYDADTGGFWWRNAGSKRDPSFDLSTRASHGGYIKVMVNRRYYSLHRLAWAYHYGVWPVDCIDHINRDRRDNRIANLREANRRQNRENTKRATGVSGLPGVTWAKARNKWAAQIRSKGVSIKLGYFLDKHEAHAVYLKAREELHEYAPT